MSLRINGWPNDTGELKKTVAGVAALRMLSHAATNRTLRTRGAVPLWITERKYKPLEILPKTKHDNNLGAPKQELRLGNPGWSGIDAMTAILTAELTSRFSAVPNCVRNH